jgi:hypothetical protein
LECEDRLDRQARAARHAAGDALRITGAAVQRASIEARPDAQGSLGVRAGPVTTGTDLGRSTGNRMSDNNTHVNRMSDTTHV